MKAIITLLLVTLAAGARAQDGVTFRVEELSRPAKPIYTVDPVDVWENLILSDFSISPRRVKNLSRPVGREKKEVDVPFNIIARGDAPGKLVDLGYHAFFDGMYRAYADHRPFVLSPDMIWLLVSQGFARHVNANPDALRDRLVNHAGTRELVVHTDEVKLDDPRAPWEKIFPAFARQIAEHAGQELVDLLSCDFSTTTPAGQIASRVTIMEAMKPYFKFVIFYTVCGIPEITLTGTPRDWKRVREKARRLGKYDLEWWTRELDPLLKQCERAARGKVDKKFWRNMFKYHAPERYGAPGVIDGWIVKFFPYDKDGKRNDLESLRGGDQLPPEIVKVDVEYRSDTGTTPLELWAGFTGLQQDSVTFALKPVISWMIRKKNLNDEIMKLNFGDGKRAGDIDIKVKELPGALLDMEEIEYLSVEFIDQIIVPAELARVKIKRLALSGKIDDEGIERIKSLFPACEIFINGKWALNRPGIPNVTR
ncbi:MAG: DUF4419 domain-containing protein [Odoribacteraceae bacterium]|jgi:hypothetical protein|nr:DUF4419 domain-containing protein [Odoribacteraceae bacterium]